MGQVQLHCCCCREREEFGALPGVEPIPGLPGPEDKNSCHSPVSDNRCIDRELKLAHAWDCVQRNSKSVQTEDNGDVPRSREATRDVEVHWRRARNLSRAGIAMRSLLQEIREGRARLCESESPVRTAVRVRSWSDATVIPCPEGIHQKHVEAPASSSSHGWQRARQLARTVNVMGHLLDDVRSKQTESVYSTDWTRIPHSSSPAARAHWHCLRSAADTGHVFQNMLNGVRSRHTEDMYSRDWTNPSSQTGHQASAGSVVTVGT